VRENERQTLATQNPFLPAVTVVLSQMRALEWSFPFLHTLLALVALVVVFLILTALIPTVGLLLQLSELLNKLADDAYQLMKGASGPTGVGFAVSFGILFLLTTPFMLMAAPFLLSAAIARKISSWLSAGRQSD